MGCSRTDVRRQIDRLFETGRADAAWLRARQHVQSCGECGEYYNRLTLLQSQLERNEALLSDAQLGVIGDEVLSRIGAARPEPSWSWHRWWLPSVAMVSAAVVVLILVPPLLTESDAEYRARGGATPSAIGVRTFCIDHKNGAKRVRLGHSSASSSSPRCRLSDDLKFSYSNTTETPSLRYLFLFGVDEASRPLWYHPHPNEGGSIEVATGPDAIDVPLAGKVRLSINHKRGFVRVIGVFTAEPLQVHDVETWLEKGQPGGPQGLASGGEVATLRLKLDE